MKLGIVGLPNVGKSTLFNSMTLGKAEAANYPFCTIDPNVGVVPVPDPRLNTLSTIYESKKIIPAVIEFVDIAGLVRGASKGEGLGNKFLSHIREVDAIVHVVRCFEDPNVIHVDGTVDSIRDIETINLELIFSDIEILERRISRTSKMVKTDKSLQHEMVILQQIKDALENGIVARSVELHTVEDKAFVDSLTLLTSKPILYAANVTEDDLATDGTENPMVAKVRAYATTENNEVFVLCAKIESEISDFDEADKKEFLADLGVSTSGLDRLVAASYHLLGLISYLTAGPQETRAWTITLGMKAPQAAGKIHTDFERGFIRAEIVSFHDLTTCGTHAIAKEQGLVRSEGKEYVMKDGDVVLFRFNV